MMQAAAFYVNVTLWFKTVFTIAQIKLKCRQHIFTLLKIFNISTFFQLRASFVVWKQNYLRNSPQLRFCDFFLSFFQPQILQNFCELMNVDILQLLCCSTDGRHQSNNVIQSLMLLKDAFLIYAYNNAGYDDLDDC